MGINMGIKEVVEVVVGFRVGGHDPVVEVMTQSSSGLGSSSDPVVVVEVVVVI